MKVHIYSRSICTHRGEGPAPGGVRGAESQSTAKLWRRVDLCGRSGAPDQSPWCGEPSCFHDFSHPHQQSNLSGSAETMFNVQSARNLSPAMMEFLLCHNIWAESCVVIVSRNIYLKNTALSEGMV